jgi:NADH-quinone oxidoreductase subunit N
MDRQQLFALLPIICLSTSVLAVMLAVIIRRQFALACQVASAGIVLTLLSIVASGDSPVQVTSLLIMDHYALFFMALLLLAGLAVIAFCYDYFSDHAGNNEEILILILTALLGSMVLVASCHFAAFFIGLETLSVSLFVLIGYCFEHTKALEATIKYLILSGVSSAFILMGMAFIYAQSGVLDFNGISHYLANQPQIEFVVLSGIVFIIAGLGFKLSLVPFHLWAADVYEGASAPIASFVATVSKGAVFALLLRYMINSGSYVYVPLLTILKVIAVITIVIGNLLALEQQNVKRLLAYSSIAHIGYLLLALIAGSSITGKLLVETVNFYLVAYFIAMLGAFGVIATLSTPKDESLDFSCYQGLFWRKPWLAATFTIMLLSLAGIPMTAGFIAKFYLFTAGVAGKLWGLLLILIAGSGLGLYYYLRIIIVMSMNMTSNLYQPDQPIRKNVSFMTLAILTILVIWFGVFPKYLTDFL